MKKLLFLILFGLSVSLLLAQTNYNIQAATHPPITFNSPLGLAQNQVNNSGQRTSNCGPDSIGYLRSKAVSLRGLNLNSSSSALAQFFPAPGSMQISGAQFYAWVGPNQGVTSVNVTVSLYNADVIDSLPTGSPLASSVITVDTSFGSGLLTTLIRSAAFSSPVTVTNPYIIVVENTAPTNVAIVCNNWETKDGRFEWLSSLKLGGIWQRSYFITVGLDTFNSDAILEPFVNYNINPQLTADKTCLTGNDTVVLTGNSDPFIDSKFYNQSFLSTFFGSYYWDFGDGNQDKNITDTAYIYSDNNSHLVKFYHRVFGWNMNCMDSAMVQLEGLIDPGFSVLADELEITLIDTSTNAITHKIDLGDGTTSNLDSVTHTYAQEGIYQVCVFPSNNCDADTFCADVKVCYNVLSDFSLTTLNESVALFSESEGADSLLWDFDNGQTSSDENPTATYTENGFYQICLTAFNSCSDSTDKTCQLIEIDFFDGVEENKLESYMLLFPNPASDNVQVIYAGAEIINDIAIHNVFGKQIYYSMWQGDKHNLDLSKMPVGNYFIKLSSNNTAGWKKLSLVR